MQRNLRHTTGAPEHILGVPEVQRTLVCRPQGGLPEHTLRHCEIETGVSESSRRVSVFLYVCQGVKQASFYSRQGN